MDREAFKKLISYLESSSGKQTDHPVMKSGIHEGTNAIGEYGMMPITAQQMAKEAVNKTPLDDIVQKADPKAIEEILASNPQKYNQYVNQMSDKVVNKSEANPEEAAMRWLAGPNSSDRRLASVEESNPSRVNKINESMNSSEPVKPTFTEKLLDQIPQKEILYNKIRSKMKLP